MNSELKNIIEAVLMVSDTPLSVAKIQSVFDKETVPDAEEIKSAITALQEDCESRAIELRKIGSGFRFQTRIEYADWIRKLQAGRPPRMSRALLETLAIIAYRQPVTRGDIEEIRGVSVSSEILQRLLEREWVKQVGVRDTPGRPALFGTTPEFLSYFNLRSTSELPPLMDQRELGDIARGLSTPLPPEVLAALEGISDSGASEDSQQDVFDVNLEATGAETPDMVIQTRGQDIDWQFEEGSAVESEVLEPDVET
jgi:segregation and condensation protein B